jgi:osmoprotectant transport system permease protein
MKRTDSAPRDAMYEQIKTWDMETNGVLVLGRLGFENAYAFAMRRDRAEELGVETLADLAPVAPRLTVGGDPEFFERPEWVAVREAYGMRFGETRNFSPTFMYNALVSGEADAISAYTSDGRIAAYDLVVLEDPKEALPSYDAMLMLSPRVAGDDRLKAALEQLIGAIDVEAMRRANYMVDRKDEEKVSPAEAARWLAREIGL